MNPVDFRNETWETLQERLAGMRMVVWAAWGKYGPGTTRDVAQRAKIDILQFRPRTTELFQLGFVELTPDQPKSGEGTYQIVQWMEAKARFEAKKREAFQPELQLQ